MPGLFAGFPLLGTSPILGFETVIIGTGIDVCDYAGADRVVFFLSDGASILRLKLSSFKDVFLGSKSRTRGLLTPLGSVKRKLCVYHLTTLAILSRGSGASVDLLSYPSPELPQLDLPICADNPPSGSPGESSYSVCVTSTFWSHSMVASQNAGKSVGSKGR